MAKTPKIKELIGKDLSTFKIVEMTEVYKIDDDGRKSVTIGYFKDKKVAIAFAGQQTDANWHKTESALILTDGTVGYLMCEQTEEVRLFNDEEEAVKIKQKALEKLTPEERSLLGHG